MIAGRRSVAARQLLQARFETAPRPQRVREGHSESDGQNRRRSFVIFSRPCRGASRIGGGGAVRFRWFPVAPRTSPPANLFRASGSGDEFQLDVRDGKPLCSEHVLGCHETDVSNCCSAHSNWHCCADRSGLMASCDKTKGYRMAGSSDSLTNNRRNVPRCRAETARTSPRHRQRRPLFLHQLLQFS